MNKVMWRDKTRVDVESDGRKYGRIGGSYYCGNCGKLIGSRQEKECRYCKEKHEWGECK